MIRFSDRPSCPQAYSCGAHEFISLSPRGLNRVGSVAEPREGLDQPHYVPKSVMNRLSGSELVGGADQSDLRCGLFKRIQSRVGILKGVDDDAAGQSIKHWRNTV